MGVQISGIRKLVRAAIPSLYERLRLIKHPSEAQAIADFIESAPSGHKTEYENIARRLQYIHPRVESAHRHEDIMPVASFILNNAPCGHFVEAGCFKGASAAKFSVLCKMTGRKLLLFDSFEGIPPNDEKHFGSVIFPEGDYAGSIEEVRNTISKLGAIDTVTFNKGWLEDTLPRLSEPIAGAYIDVDLESSTRTCIKYLYPLLRKGGTIFSQDGHLPRIIELLNNNSFWEEDLGIQKPRIENLGKKTLVSIFKD